MEEPTDNSAAYVFLCREGFEATLVAEIQAKCRVCAGRDPAPPALCASGLVRVPGPIAEGAEGAFGAPFIFERQRLRDAAWIPAQGLKPMAREVVVRLLPPISRSNEPWTVHAYAPETDEGAAALAPRAANMERVLHEFLAARFPAVLRRFVPERDARPPAVTRVLQLCLTDGGAWASVMPLASLSDSRPGGVHRMPFDPLSPSRSYLKIEEAFDRMGEQPHKGETVVDLGAAPGGWSYAFLKRGCQVTAVDRGPMKLKGMGDQGGNLLHVREDGITYVPPARQLPVDWLVSDMLQPAGTNLGMIRKWLENRWMKRFVFNVKLPQQEPYSVLRPLEEHLHQSGHVRFQTRQLYHDRREVTVFGRAAQ